MRTVKKVPVAKEVVAKKPVKTEKLLNIISTFEIDLKPVVILLVLNLLVSMSWFTLYLFNTFLFVK